VVLPPTDKGTCADPLDVTLPFAGRISAAQHAPEPVLANGCFGSATARASVHRVSVPPNETLAATFRGYSNPGGGLPIFYLGSSCAQQIQLLPTTCWDGGTNGSPWKAALTWKNDTPAAVSVYVVGARMHTSAAELEMHSFTSATDPCGSCGANEACVSGTCSTMADTCPAPNVLLASGACGAPSQLTSDCNCMGPCGASESCIDGACVTAPAGEKCENPLDIPLHGVLAPGAPIDGEDFVVRSSDQPAISSPVAGPDMTPLDATFRFSPLTMCTHLWFRVNPETAQYAAAHAEDGWMLAEVFDEQGCSVAPIRTQLFGPQSAFTQLPSWIDAPPGATRLRLTYLALDHQAPLMLTVGGDTGGPPCN